MAAALNPAEGPNIEPNSSNVPMDATTTTLDASCEVVGCSERPDVSRPSSSHRGSNVSSGSLREQRLAIQAAHARRMAVIEAEREQKRAIREEAAAKREEVIANLELQAELAALEDHSTQSYRSLRLDRWVTHSASVTSNKGVCPQGPVDVNAPTIQTASERPAGRERMFSPSAVDSIVTVREHAPPIAPVPSSAGYERVASPCAAGLETTAREHASNAPAPSAFVSFRSVPPKCARAISPCAAGLSAAAREHARFHAPAPAFQHPLHTASPTLGTLRYNCNKNKILNSNGLNTAQPEKPSDILKLAEVISDLACRNSSKVSADVKLPIFSGLPTDWLTFRSSFLNSKASFSATENIGRLNNALRGAARDSVIPLLALSQDPNEIMAALQEQFGQPELLIRHIVSEVKAMPRLPASLDGGKELHQLSCMVRNCVHTIKMTDSVEFLASPELFHNVLIKLTPLMREKWVDFAHTNYEPHLFKLELLSKFLTHQSRIHLKFGIHDDGVRQKSIDKVRTHATMDVEPTDDNDEVCYATSINYKQKVATSTAKAVSNKPTPSQDSTCKYCLKESHDVVKCDKFLALDVTDRWRWATQNKVCRRCLKKGGHFYQTCKGNCDKVGCRAKIYHHALLHKDFPPPAPVNYSVPEPEEPADPVVVAHAHGNYTAGSTPPTSPLQPLLKVLPVTVSGPKGELDVYALLDDGSTLTLIDQSVVDFIGAEGPRGAIRVNCVGGLARDSEVTYVDIKIKGKHCDETFVLNHVRAIPNLGLATQTLRAKDLAKFPHLKELTTEFEYAEAKPMIIIGIDHWYLSLPHEIRRGNRNQPVAIRTVLGWTIFGKYPGKPVESVYHSSATELEALIKENYQLDSIGIIKKDLHSANDERAIKILEETTKRLPTGRFETGLLWRADVTTIPNSYNLAMSRFRSLENKFKKNPIYAEAYREYINTMLAKDYAEICTNKAPVGNLWYLPHFGVYHPQKKKLRLVHDAAAKSSGVSLNTLLLPGPDLLQPLLAILMRFREGKVALNGDIREMFPQTKIRDQDKDAQRFLWRADPSLPIEEYRMSSMIFGAVSSPCSAIFLKNRNALEFKDKYPEATEAIIKDHYMDDYLGSVDSPQQAARLAADIVTVHEAACLEMRSWVSNEPEALSLLKPELRAVDTSMVGLGPPSCSSPSQVRILGVAWNINDDTLSFRKTFQLPIKYSKRLVLSRLMQVYDPLGFLMPVVIAGRILFQETWRMGLGWDEELPSAAIEKWKAWFASLTEVSNSITIPRCYRINPPQQSQLHVLADASELAYACVAFWRFVHEDGSISLALIGGKARLAPLKPASIPRLELQAALVASRFATYILEAHRIVASKVYFWTDSLTVLKWLRSDARTFKPFVAHRVGEILETTNVSDWRYVPSAMNVADDATRGQISLSALSRWFTGPKFLFAPAEEWPREPTSDFPPVLDELKAEHALALLITEQSKPPSPVVADPSHFSRWDRLVRATARIHSCVKRFRSLLGNKTQNFKSSKTPLRISSVVLPPLSAGDIREAERHLFLQSQLDSFSDEFWRLISHLPPVNHGKLRNLVLMLGEDLLIHLNGRIRAVSQAPTQDIDPIVLDGRHPIVRLLLDHYHKKLGHGNTESVVNILRSNFYIVALRPSVKSVAKNCAFCRVRKLLPSVPQFGDLPVDRLAHHQRPFTFTGLDYFGPVEVTVGRRREKRWVGLFTCLTTRAVHLEVVASLSADSAIMALRRFIARRGCPLRITSDNGTAFVGAANQLQEVFDFAAGQKIEWVFIPPAAPSMGGSWERLVRSIKAALAVTLKEKAPKEEVLTTLLLEAEAVVNSRPLTHVPVEPNTLQALTPYHFLLGTPSVEAVQPASESDLWRRQDYKKALYLAEVFWSRWVREYLPTLIPRKTGVTRAPLSENDPVLLVDQNLPRGTWPRGRITKIYKGPDGIARVVEVQTNKGPLRRPVRKVVPLITEKDAKEHCASALLL